MIMTSRPIRPALFVGLIKKEAPEKERLDAETAKPVLIVSSPPYLDHVQPAMPVQALSGRPQRLMLPDIVPEHPVVVILAGNQHGQLFPQLISGYLQSPHHGFSDILAGRIHQITRAAQEALSAKGRFEIAQPDIFRIAERSPAKRANRNGQLIWPAFSLSISRLIAAGAYFHLCCQFLLRFSGRFLSFLKSFFYGAYALLVQILALVNRC